MVWGFLGFYDYVGRGSSSGSIKERLSGRHSCQDVAEANSETRR